MTSIGPRKLIRHENVYPLNESAADRNDSRKYHPFPGPKQNSLIPNPIYPSSAGSDFDERLRTYENAALRKFFKIKNSLNLETLPGWLYRMLDQTILPALDRIGCDEQIARTLFEIAPSAWMYMGLENEKVIAFHPEINHAIEEVRQGIERSNTKSNGDLPRFPGGSPAFIAGSITEEMSPEHLFELLDDIATSWIILPRAFRFLEQEHCRYLPQYLNTIEGKTSQSCRKLFSRITLEFIGNFSLKFASEHHPSHQIAHLLFNGYSALFWKTLRNPPPRMENSAAFYHFFKWTSRLARQSKFLGNQAVPSIERMQKMKLAVFPGNHVSIRQSPGRPVSSRFVVTLRHGTMGIATILKYLGVDQFIDARQAHDRLASSSFSNELCTLLHTIQTNYHLESKRTRANIRQFIGHLQAAWENLQPAAHQHGGKFLMRMFNNLQALFGN